MIRIALALAIWAGFTAASFAQNVTVIGPITPGDCTMFSSTTVIKDGGLPCPGSGGTLNLPNGTTATTQPAADNTTKVATDAFVESEISRNSTHFAAGGTTTGSANAQVISTVSPPVFSLTGNPTVTFIAGFSNSGATTLNVASSGAVSILKKTPSGLVALVTGDLISGQQYLVTYDGTQYELQTPSQTVASQLAAIGGGDVSCAAAGNCTIAAAAVTGAKIASATVTGSNIATNTVANSNLSQMAGNTIKGNNTGSTANAADLTIAQTQFMLGIQGQPGGRLTVQNTVPVPSADQTAVTSIFYAPCGGVFQGCAGPFIPVYDGTNMRWRQFTSSTTDTTGLSLTLNTSAQLNGNLYDIFVGDNSGLQMCTGPAWSNSTAGSSARGTGAGTTQLALFLGIWTNAVSMTCKFGSSNFTCGVNQCTYVGTMYATANGQTSVQIHPAAASTGSNSIVGLCNAYNRVRIQAKQSDSTSTWTYASATTRNADNSANNRIRFIDCLGTVQARATYGTSFASNAGAGTATAVTVGIGYNLDCTSATNFSGGGGAGAYFGQGASNNSAIGSQSFGSYSPYPTLGLNFIQACEQSTAQSVTFFGNDFMQLILDYEM